MKRLKKLAIAMLGAAALLGHGAAGAQERIQFWTMSLKPKFIPYFETLVKQYESENPGVKIDWVDYPWDVIQSKLTTAIGAGRPPELVNLNVPWAEEYARDSMIQPVDALLGADRARYAAGALQDLTFNGKVYGFPHYSNVSVTLINRRIATDAGLDLKKTPQSLDEQLKAATQIASRTKVAGLAPALGKIDGIFLQQGLPVIKDGRAAFNSPAHVALIGKYAEAYRSGALLKDNLFSEDNFQTVMDAYKAGRLGMLVAPPTALTRVRDDAKDVYAQTEVAPVPLGPAKIAEGGWLFHFAVPTGVDSKKLPAVARFAKFLTSDENQLKFAIESGTFPTTLKAAQSPHFQKKESSGGAFEKAVSVAAGSMNHSRSLYVSGVPDYELLRRKLVDAVEAGVTGKKDIRRALDEAAAFWNSRLAG